MKNLLLLTLLTACIGPPSLTGPNLKKGDCVQYGWSVACEKWQDNCKITTYKIVNVGKEHYQVLLYYSNFPHRYFLLTETFSRIENMPKVECWANFGDGEGDEVFKGIDES